MKEEDMETIAEIIHIALTDFDNSKEKALNMVKDLTDKYPLYA